MSNEEVVVIIPARYGSKRLPGKPLIPINGRPLVLCVLDRARKIPAIDRIIVGTDDDRILEVVRKEGGEAVLTPVGLLSGSDRVGWIAQNLQSRIIVNLQGDEPLFDVKSVQKGIETIIEEQDLDVVSLGFPLTSEEEWKNPDIVKVLTNDSNYALYFSRCPIPYYRDGDFYPVPSLYKHIGIYIYKRSFLLKFLKWDKSPLENAEKLEQLRILYKGCNIKIIRSNSPSIGVDVSADIERVEKILKGEITIE